MYEKISWTRIIVGGVLLLAALAMTAHWFIHPNEEHPPGELLFLLYILAAGALLPVEFQATMGHAKGWLPWGQGEDRRETCGTCGHPVHPSTPCAVPTVQGECGCTGQ